MICQKRNSKSVANMVTKSHLAQGRQYAKKSLKIMCQLPRRWPLRWHKIVCLELEKKLNDAGHDLAIALQCLCCDYADKYGVLEWASCLSMPKQSPDGFHDVPSSLIIEIFGALNAPVILWKARQHMSDANSIIPIASIRAFFTIGGAIIGQNLANSFIFPHMAKQLDKIPVRLQLLPSRYKFINKSI